MKTESEKLLDHWINLYKLYLEDRGQSENPTEVIKKKSSDALKWSAEEVQSKLEIL
jgi:hypothetical protein